MNIKTFNCNMLQEKCYLLSSGSSHVLIDPGFWREAEFQTLYDCLGDAVPAAILLTHGHFDHVLGVNTLLQKYPGLRVYMAPADSEILADSESNSRRLGLKDADFGFECLPLQDGQILSFGDISLKVIATPGHTPGGVCFYSESEGLLFSGDTLFADAIGRTDLFGGDYDSLIRAILEKLIILPGDTAVYPGHGPSTTIAHERDFDPFLEPFNEPEETFDPDLPGISIHR